MGSSIGSNSNSSSSSHNNNNNFAEKTREIPHHHNNFSSEKTREITHNNFAEKTREIAHKINLKSHVGVEPAQDTIRKAFEAQLIAGKNKLKKIEDEVGQVAKPPPAPVPPPLPPPVLPSYHHTSTVHQGPNSFRSYQIPQAPKLKKVVSNHLSNKKGLVAPNGLSARDELMNAIRGTGGFQGLRKTNSGKNL